MTLPDGTVTFLRSDIEGSMTHARALGARYDQLNAEHAALVRGVLEEHGGEVVRTEGDAFFAVFTEAGPAARAAVDIQRVLAGHRWPEGHELRVRIGLHTGAATRAGDDYGGFEVNRAARIAAAGNGGQIVLSDPTRALLAAELPDDWRIEMLGRIRLKGVAEAEPLFGLTAPGLAADFEPLRSESSRAEHLPQRLSSFVGREAELAELAALLADTRLLTLVGPGGTGKTTLAIELARRHAADYADGAWFVDLQEVRDVTRVRERVALGLGLLDGPTGTASDRLSPFVADRALLLVVDNFEQVIEAAGVVADILTASPASTAIVTSRAPLRLSAEQEYPLAPLPTRSPGGAEVPDAMRLFVDRTRRVAPGLRLDHTGMEHVRAICDLVDGLPLAIELAAARANSLPLAVIHERLSQHLPLPGAGPRGLPQRQRTIESTTAWSCDLLDEPMRRLLGRLSIFVGSFGYEQAETVCGPAEDLGIDVLEGLVELSQRSLLQRADDAPGELRYRLLETVRAYAADHLCPAGDSGLLRARHALAYQGLAESFFEELPLPIHREELARVEPDSPNLRAACMYLIEQGQTTAALETCARIWRLWQRTGQLQLGLELVSSALALPGAEAPSRARVRALSAHGSLLYWSGELPAAHARYQEQAEVARRIGDRLGEGDACVNLAFTYALQGDVAGGRQAGERASEVFEEIGDRRREAVALVSRILVERFSNPDEDPGTAVEQLEGWVDRVGAEADPMIREGVHSMRAMICLRHGDYIGSGRELMKTIRFELAQGDRASAIANFGAQLANLLPLGLLETAALVYAAAEEARARHGIVAPASLEHFIGIDDATAELQRQLDATTFDRLMKRGRHISLDTLADEVEEALRRVSPG